MTRRRHLLACLIALAAVAQPAWAQQNPLPGEIFDAARTLWVREASLTRLAPQVQARLQNSGPEITEAFSRTIRMERSGTFDLSNLSGDIVITGGGGADVTIAAVKRTRGRDEAAGLARLQEIGIAVRKQGNRVEVRTEYPLGRGGGFGSVDYTVSVPQDADVVVKSVSGDVRVVNVRGGLRVDTVSGDIEASGARRLESVRSVSGSLRITDAEAPDLVTLQTVSGDQTVEGLKARSLDSRSVSGDVRLERVDVERATLRTVSGTIGYGGRLARHGRYEIASHAGDIRLAVDDSGFEVDASTFSGNFRSDYALVPRGGDSAGDARGRRPRVNRTLGSHGDGSAILSLRSFRGNIVIGRQEIGDRR